MPHLYHRTKGRKSHSQPRQEQTTDESDDNTMSCAKHVVHLVPFSRPNRPQRHRRNYPFQRKEATNPTRSERRNVCMSFNLKFERPASSGHQGEGWASRLRHLARPNPTHKTPRPFLCLEKVHHCHCTSPQLGHPRPWLFAN